ncbi:MAG: resolvase [Planctomycetes bacterium GWC2_45_44]|nr:MAG: resolvase [Planctomycetes bacterium GWC2_45_44]
MNEKKIIRCAIYTRKSTEEGLEQDYNSLDAQRDAAEAYIKSQKQEGWVCLPEKYDDGGYTGGNLDRPAAQRLLADVQEGKIDCIMVYKVDRLSRSLMDFARIIQILDKNNVSFVSVTQQFNTTTSMGRLTLNILLSFAQFEREIISERTRDKIAGARRKGKWTGGRPILGYDILREPGGSKLMVNPPESRQVRQIFEKYLETGSLMATLKWLDEEKQRNKQYKAKDGKTNGGLVFAKSSLQRLLTNVIYIGRISHKENVYQGEHQGIVDEGLFSQVQSLLKMNRRSGGPHRNKYDALLKGLVRCKHCGCAMTHHYVLNDNKRYRYYVCINAQKRGWSNCVSPSLPAVELEEFVIGQIRTLRKDDMFLSEVLEKAQAKLYSDVEQHQAALKTSENEMRKMLRSLGEISAQAAYDSRSADKLAELQEQIKQKEQAMTVLNEKIIVARRRMVDTDEMTGAIEAFDPIWQSLTPNEQTRLIRLLVQQVEYDGENKNIAVTFHPTGIKSLTHEEVCV